MAAALAVLATACVPVPQPFRPPDDAPPNPLLEISDIAGVYVTPVQGTTVPMGRLLARAVAEALNDKDVPAFVSAPRRQRFLLAGQVDSTIKGSWVVRWRLLDPKEIVVAEHEERIEGPAWRWEYGDPALLRTIGIHVAEAFVKVARPEDPTLMPAPETPAVSVFVGPVEGAPGDGNASLRRAVRTALRLAKVPLSEVRDGAALLTARVEMGPARGGSQPIRIVWRLDDPAGVRIGEAAQANAVPQGSLDGPWGEVAGFAAEAAVEGILDLVAGATRGPASAPMGKPAEGASPQAPRPAAGPR